MDTIFNNDYFELPRLTIIPEHLLQTENKKETMPSKLCVARIGYLPNAHTFAHENPKGSLDTILLFCSKGSGCFSIDNQQETLLEAGQAVLIPAGTPYRYKVKENHCWTVYWLHLQGEMTSTLAPSILAGQVYTTHEAYQDYILQQFTHCFRILQKPCQEDEMLLLSQLASSILGMIVYANKKAELPISPKGREALKSATYYMRLHLKRSLTLEEIATATGFSASHLTHLFKIAVHHTPVDYFLRLKIHAAAEQLYFTQKTVREVALDYGISDPYYFSRLFKKIMGVSPSEYREAMWKS